MLVPDQQGLSIWIPRSLDLAGQIERNLSRITGARRLDQRSFRVLPFVDDQHSVVAPGEREAL
jgi:hypothetical protein